VTESVIAAIVITESIGRMIFIMYSIEDKI